jgi:thiamine-phosphate diphosphorylase/hydroxyethylthiazole kinase
LPSVSIQEGSHHSKTLTPGGIHLPNLPQLLHASVSPAQGNALAGIAVISDIVGSTDPKGAAQQLRSVLDSFKRSQVKKTAGLFRVEEGLSEKDLLERVGTLMEVTRRETPLVNQVSALRQSMRIILMRRSPTMWSLMTRQMLHWLSAPRRSWRRIQKTLKISAR